MFQEAEMQRMAVTMLALVASISMSACNGGNGGGEAQPQPTPQENVPESDPAGVGGTSNQ